MVERIDEKQPPTVLTSDTDNATFIRPEDARPEEREKYRRFRAYNTGLWNGPRRENTEMFRRQDNLHIYDALSSQLELTQYQKSRGREVFDDIDLRATGKPVEHIIFGVCVCIANADVDGTRYWPHPKKADNDELFGDIADSLGLSRKEQLSAVQVIKNRTGL